jgi:hypothetical protein
MNSISIAGSVPAAAFILLNAAMDAVADRLRADLDHAG